MYIDANLVVSGTRSSAGVWTAQTLETTELSTYSIDLDAAKNLSKGKQLYFVVLIETVFASNTVNFQVVTADNAALSSNLVVQMETGAIAYASLTADRTPIVIPIGSAIDTEDRYLGLRYTLSGSGETGAVIAFLAFDTP